MTTHLQREIERLKRKILAQSAVVEESLRQAFAALERRDAALATRVIDGDSEVDEIEVDIEEDCLKILALYQPVASDLRFLVAVIKINHRLERLGDLAASVAKRSLALVEHPSVEVPEDFYEMAEKSGAMISRALDSLVKRDTTLAKLVLVADDEVDAMYRKVQEELKDAIRDRPESLDALVEVFAVARYLERIGDHATNIAEDVIYMNEGEIARHKAGVFEFDRGADAASAKREETT
ncbi:MAG TPA: phosphate signaling complex protein PhoU [Thermoleophilia bacterium]|nr:phosphate signaling complex protein PhoU [Thermoleophilia bacterium]